MRRRYGSKVEPGLEVLDPPCEAGPWTERFFKDSCRRGGPFVVEMHGLGTIEGAAPTRSAYGDTAAIY